MVVLKNETQKVNEAETETESEQVRAHFLGHKGLLFIF